MARAADACDSSVDFGDYSGWPGALRDEWYMVIRANTKVFVSVVSMQYRNAECIYDAASKVHDHHRGDEITLHTEDS